MSKIKFQEVKRLVKMLRRQNVRAIMRVYLVIIVSYLLVKFGLRPMIVANGYPLIIEIFVLSYPNFCEGVVGPIFVTFVLLTIKGMLVKKKPSLVLKDNWLYLVAVLFSAFYVLLQEFKIHNLGGKNVYDPYDVLFSVLGLVTACYLLLKIEPQMEANE